MKSFIAVIILLLSFCTRTTDKQIADDVEEYQIYSLALDDLVGKSQEKINLQNTTLVMPEVRLPSTDGNPLMNSDLKSAIDNFERKNKASIEIQNNLARANVTLISAREKSTADWNIKLSQVGFSTDKTQAILYIDYYCGLRCGGGQYELFTRNNGKWVLKKTLMKWAS